MTARRDCLNSERKVLIKSWAQIIITRLVVLLAGLYGLLILPRASNEAELIKEFFFSPFYRRINVDTLCFIYHVFSAKFLRRFCTRRIYLRSDKSFNLTVDSIYFKIGRKCNSTFNYPVENTVLLGNPGGMDDARKLLIRGRKWQHS